jgi:ATP-dependent RNA helicase DeaD
VNGFADLGLSEELVAAAAALGWDAPLPIQRAAIPVLRRGGNALLRASSGSGVTGAYGLALLDRLQSGEPAGEGTRVLILVPHALRAEHVAETLARLGGGGGGVRVAALAAGWRGAGSAHVLVATPAAAAAAVAESALKLSALEALVLDGAPALMEPAAANALDALLVSIPAESQRIITTPAWDRAVDRFAEAHARRALSIPARPADPEGGVTTSRGAVAYTMIPAHARDVVLAGQLDTGAHRKVAVRGTARAAAVRDTLAARGYLAGEDGVEVASFGSDEAEGATLAYDVPADAEALARLGPDAVVLVAPSEQPHLRAIAADAGIGLRPLPPPREPRLAVGEYRAEIRRALESEDVDAQLSVLEPLFDEYSPAEVAAALSAILRRRKPVAEKAVEAGARPAEAGARGRPFVRLFVSVGQKDGIRPAEVVGAFTSEAGITGEQVGRIEIRETFSVVEVDPDVADLVIHALNGTTLRGRSMRVDYDRKRSDAPRRAPPGQRAPRGKGQPRR